MTISIDFTPGGHYGVFKAHLNMPWRREEIVSEMDSADFGITHEQQVYEDHYWTNVRHKLYPEKINESTPIMLALQVYISSDAFKTFLINHCYKEMPIVFQENWGDWGPEKMIANTHTHAEFVKDSPGLSIPMHTDSRVLVGGGMIYFAENNDPKIATVFYGDADGGNPVPMSTDYCNGWFHVNSNNSYHSGGNASDYMRYAMLFWLSVSTKC